MHNVNGNILRGMTKNLSDAKGLFGIGNLKYGFGFGCMNHVARSLWAVGVPTLPINIHPWILNAQLFIREVAIYSSPILTNYYGR